MADRGETSRDSETGAGVLVLSPNWLGDAVMALPAIADLKRHFGAPLIVAARASVAGMFRLAPHVDDVVVLRWGGKVTSRAGWSGDIRDLRRAAPGTAVVLPNSFASAWLAWRSGARARWGYAADLRSPLLTRAVRRPAGSVHQSEYYQHLVRELGIPTGPREAVLRVPDSAMEAARALLAARGWAGEPLAVMAPGAAYGTAKQWLPEHFAQLANMLGAERGVRTVLVGSAADRPATAGIAASATLPAATAPIDLAGETSIGALAGVMSLGQVCVSNDSGAMHVAAAIGIPVAALFGPTRERETSPLPRAGRRAEVLINPVSCRPCMLRECPIDHRCMQGLLPAQVLRAVGDLMDGPR